MLEQQIEQIATLDLRQTENAGRKGALGFALAVIRERNQDVRGLSRQEHAMLNLPLKKVSSVDYGPDEAAMTAYRQEGTRRALALDNRGPIRFDTNGNIDPTIVDAYTRHGFYIFENVLKGEELLDLERDLADILERAPVAKGAKRDRQGRPGLGVGNKGRTFTWVEPLSDPRGGTDEAHGRYPTKMIEPSPAHDAPEHVVQVLLGTLQYSDACLRLYGHPDLLAVAAAINGEGLCAVL